MEDNKPVVAKSDQELAKDFVKDYEALCEKHQLRIITTPTFVSTNHGSYEIALQTSVGKLPK